MDVDELGAHPPATSLANGSAPGGASGSGSTSASVGLMSGLEHEGRRQGQFVRRRTTVALILLTTLSLFADQNLMAPNLTAIATEFGMNAEERDAKLGGQVAIAYFVVGGPVAVVLGLMADTVPNRLRVFGLLVLLGELPVLLMEGVTTFAQFICLRAATGIAVGGALPLVYSMFADFFHPSRRSWASAAVALASTAGVGIGQIVAGLIGPRLGWRLPFELVALTTCLLAGSTLLLGREPRRGTFDRHEEGGGVRDAADDAELGLGLEDVALFTRDAGSYSDPDGDVVLKETQSLLVGDRPALSGRGAGGGDGRIPVATASSSAAAPSLMHEPLSSVPPSLSLTIATWRATLERVMSVPTNALIFLQGFPGCLPWSVINAFLNDFLSEDRGMPVEVATTLLFWIGLGAGIGSVAGGYIGQRVYNWDRRWVGPLMGGTTAAGAIPLFYLVNLETIKDAAPGPLMLTSLAGGVIAGVTGPNAKSVLLGVNGSTQRGTAASLHILLDDIGKGLGPFFVAKLSSGLGGRVVAFNAAISGWLICGALLASTFFTIEEDSVDARPTLRPGRTSVPVDF